MEKKSLTHLIKKTFAELIFENKHDKKAIDLRLGDNILKTKLEFNLLELGNMKVRTLKSTRLLKKNLQI